MSSSLYQTKIIYVQCDETKKSDSFTVTISCISPLVDLSSIIMQIPNWQAKYFQIYSPHEDSYINLHSICSENFRIPIQYLDLSFILIKYMDSQEKSDEENHSEENKKERSKERNLREVIELVHQWRQLHGSSFGTNRKMNLQESAKVVGISKKSLDDYFFQLRMGEKYGFDFTSNMDNKIGQLRSFVKQKQQSCKNSTKQKIFRHPRKLKIIQEFAEKLNLTDTKQAQVENLIELKSIKSEDVKIQHDACFLDSSQIFWGSPFSPIEQKAIMDCQNNFFKDFQLMEEPNDPFINFANFNKTKPLFSEDSSSNISF